MWQLTAIKKDETFQKLNFNVDDRGNHISGRQATGNAPFVYHRATHVLRYQLK